MPLYILAMAVAMAGCGAYSFTGTNLSPDIKSITIQNFPNVSGAGPALLTQTFSEKLRDYFQRNTNLSLVPQQGDLLLDGSIVGYELTPIAPSSNDLATQTRLTIRVKANFINTRDEEQNFEETFSFFKDFPASTNLSSVEGVLIDEISDQIIVQLYTRSVANW